MPTNSSSNLKFDLAAPPVWSYDGGDMIIGHLMRHTPISTTQATVELALVGRTQAKLDEGIIKKPDPDDEILHSSHYTLLPGKPQLVFRGPVHHVGDNETPLSFPFSVEIPKEPERTVREGHSQEASFLPLEGDHPSHHVLPGTFQTCNSGCSDAGRPIVSILEYKIEYFLEATLEYHSEGRHICRARYPVTIRHPQGEDSNRYVWKTITAQCNVRSHLLVPGSEQKGLDFKQKLAKMFGSSSIPSCHFQLNMTVPLAIMIGDRQPFQVTLKVTPLREYTSPIIRNVAQKVRINWVKLSLTCITNILVNDNALNPGEQHVSHVLKLEGASRGLPEGSSFVTSTEDNSEPIHIGDMFQLRLYSGGLASGRRYFVEAGCICPDFVTYNIKHHHTWRWHVSYTVAGETGEAKVEAPVELLRA